MPSWLASQGSGLAASCSPSARARWSSPAASSWATAGASFGVRCAQVASWPRSGSRSRWRRPCRTPEMDRAPSNGAAVIWSMTAPMSCPASWAARSRCRRAGREYSRSYRHASDSVSLAMMHASICGYSDGRTAADHRVSRWPVPLVWSWAWRICSVADRSASSRSMTAFTTDSGEACA
jgi:hypothetical protein